MTSYWQTNLVPSLSSGRVLDSFANKRSFNWEDEKRVVTCCLRLSCEENPVKIFAAGFIEVMIPSRSIVTKPFPIYWTIFRLRALNRNIVQYMGNGLVTIDREGIITSINPAAKILTGFSSQESLKQHVTTLFSSSQLNDLLLANESSTLPELREGTRFVCQ